MTPVEEIKSKLDIVNLIQEYFPLKQSGANFKATCPFHNEKTPSFMVSRDKQFYKCFGCGEGGDMFTFLQKMENIEFPEALKILADKAGVQLKQVSYDPKMQNLKTRLYDLHKVAVQFYSDQFFNSPLAKNAREYLINTRKLNKDIINQFQIGYAPNLWDAVSKHLRSAGFSDAEIKQSGLVVEKNTPGLDGRNYYDRFRDRIMFPIADHHGNIVGFTGRTMKNEETAKYINTPQTVIYNKSQILYGLDKAKTDIRKNNLIILVEGNMDVIASHKIGVRNVVAASGTSLTLDQITLLRRYTTNVALCFDADAAGVAAAERGIDMLWQAGMSVKVIILPARIKDPDELISKSADAWFEAIEKRVNFMDYFLRVSTAGKNLKDIDVKNSIAQKILPWLAKLVNRIEQDHYLKKLASLIEVDESSLREELNKFKTKNQSQSTPTAPEPVQFEAPKSNKAQLVSQRLLALAFYDTNYIKELIDSLAPEVIENSLTDIYKEIIFHYTKNNEFNLEQFYNYLKAEKSNLAFVFDTLQLLAHSEFSEFSPSELNREFNLTLKWLQKDHITSKLKSIEHSIRTAEQGGNRQKADELMKEFSELSRELAGL